MDACIKSVPKNIKIDFHNVARHIYCIITINISNLKNEVEYNNDVYKIFDIKDFITYIELNYKYNVIFKDEFVKLFNNRFFIKLIINYILKLDGSKNYIYIKDNDSEYIKLKKWIVLENKKIKQLKDKIFKTIDTLNELEKDIYIELLNQIYNEYKNNESIKINLNNMKKYSIETTKQIVETLIKKDVIPDIYLSKVNNSNELILGKIAESIFFEIYVKCINEFQN
jgi:hypothetical protein